MGLEFWADEKVLRPAIDEGEPFVVWHGDDVGTGEVVQVLSDIPSADEMAVAARLTNAFRISPELRWIRLREAVGSQGYSPDEAAIGILFDDDSRQDFGVLLAKDGRAFTFDFEYRGPRRDHDAVVIGPYELRHEERWIYATSLNAARGQL